MPEHIYNSRDKFYKNIYGAVAVGQTVTFRLLLPIDYCGANVTSAKMSIMGDWGKSIETYEFTKTPSIYAGSAIWELQYKPAKVGLYWYCFSFAAGASTKNVYRGAYGTGYVQSEEERWQLTVYDAKQTVSPVWRGGIMYQIFPDRFYSSGKEKKNVPSDRKTIKWGDVPSWTEDKDTGVWNNDYMGGDLKGIEEKLPYLKELGVTYIYLNPIFEAHSNHRYNTADYMKVDPSLGNEQDFFELCQEAHKLDMKVILDGVFNHSGVDSVYFNKNGRYDNIGAYQSKDSPYFGWYNFKEWPKSYSSWWGVSDLPDHNEENPSFKNFITGPGGVIEKWLSLGADGWRLDVADELPDDFIVAIKERMKLVKQDALLLGEVWEDASNKTAYGVGREYLFGNELDSVMNYPFRDAIIDYISNDNAENFFEQILTITENYPRDIVNSLMNPLGTHDTVRILTRLAGYTCENMDRDAQSLIKLTDEQKAKAIDLLKIAVAMQFTLPGFPSIYYGDEIGMEGGKDPFNRMGFRWDNINEDIHDFYKELGDMRSHQSFLRDGEFVPISAADGCVCYARCVNGDPNCALIFISNIADEPINYNLPPNISETKFIMGTAGADVQGNFVHLPERGFAILENVHVMLKEHRRGSKI